MEGVTLSRCEKSDLTSESSSTTAIVSTFSRDLFQMECSICMEQFDEGQRPPKVLPCGHTYCLRCLLALQDSVCPADRKVSN